ncbi:hypothetical protein FHW67_000357 [Herbaspirillum sp. Sphag1AN]|uniref:helix-turn-helix domain-containing protein n=1 Tax=unclassified Herbaspirillum TaxID=2624150 RepID=UPI00160BB37F|nr:MULTISPECIES: helix-turn-helix domain-containing protein [unclassified Herbaspirillum]MBB3211122.1 hypothetical protein [Herbaspirillum sp. Sphag1AN]MBB3244751.1 hypothetical protein [Herbaspirillum sp. Sphag64]
MASRLESLAAILKAIPGNDSAAQRTRMLTAMERLGHITTFEASRYLDCYDPRPRIHELRGQGKRIKTIMRQEQTESGVHHSVGVYILEGRIDA